MLLDDMQLARNHTDLFKSEYYSMADLCKIFNSLPGMIRTLERAGKFPHHVKNERYVTVVNKKTNKVKRTKKPDRWEKKKVNDFFKKLDGSLNELAKKRKSAANG
jgi:hypothetical protein